VCRRELSWLAIVRRLYAVDAHELHSIVQGNFHLISGPTHGALRSRPRSARAPSRVGSADRTIPRRSDRTARMSSTRNAARPSRCWRCGQREQTAGLLEASRINGTCSASRWSRMPCWLLAVLAQSFAVIGREHDQRGIVELAAPQLVEERRQRVDAHDLRVVWIGDAGELAIRSVRLVQMQEEKQPKQNPPLLSSRAKRGTCFVGPRRTVHGAPTKQVPRFARDDTERQPRRAERGEHRCMCWSGERHW
jgi:hypothetical protein